MTLPEARIAAINACSFDTFDKFIVIDNMSGRPIEGQPTLGRAEAAVKTLTWHERLNARDTTYRIEEVTT